MSNLRTYTYAEVADLIERELGIRPALSSLRAAAATDKRTEATLSRPRLTTGMPAKVSGLSRPARFDADAIDAWLAAHPLKVWQQTVDAFQAALRGGQPPEQAIAGARRAGLSWRQITQLWTAVDGRQRSSTTVHARFRHLDSQ